MTTSSVIYKSVIQIVRKSLRLIDFVMFIGTELKIGCLTYPRNNRTRNVPVPYWNKQCKDAVNKRKRAEHKMRKTKDLENCIEYRKSKAEAQKL